MRSSFINSIPAVAILTIVISLISCSDKKKKETTAIPTSTDSTGSIVRVLTDLQKQEDKAESDKDFATLDKLVAKNVTVTLDEFYIPNRDSFYAIMKRIPADTSAYKEPLYEDIKITSAGDTAVMDYLVTFDEKDQIRKSVLNQYHNVVSWIKINGQWQILTVHSSYIPPKK